MNREEFMAKLKALLGDIPAEEREEALQYYEDYFDDAGADNEAEVIRESLPLPQKEAVSFPESSTCLLLLSIYRSRTPEMPPHWLPVNKSVHNFPFKR